MHAAFASFTFVTGVTHAMEQREPDAARTGNDVTGKPPAARPPRNDCSFPAHVP